MGTFNAHRIALTAFLLGAVAQPLLGCTNYYARLTKEQKDILEFYFIKEDINRCKIQINKMEHSNTIAGTVRNNIDVHDNGYSFLDISQSTKYGGPYYGPVIFQPYSGTEFPDGPEKYAQREKKYDALAKSWTDPHETHSRLNMSGWIINGKIACGYDTDKFILIENYGQPNLVGAEDE
jgi:hypothetical protein